MSVAYTDCNPCKGSPSTIDLLSLERENISLGSSDDSDVIQKQGDEAVNHYLESKTVCRDLVKQLFERYASEWEDATSLYSSISERIKHEAYKKIIHLGDDIVSVILERLLEKPDYWFDALTSITGQDPIPEEYYGDLGRMISCWMVWGRENGYI